MLKLLLEQNCHSIEHVRFCHTIKNQMYQKQLLQTLSYIRCLPAQQIYHSRPIMGTPTNLMIQRKLHSDDDTIDHGVKKKPTPKLLYLQNPLRWIRNKFDFHLLKMAWDPHFVETEFKRGTKEAVVHVTKLIKTHDIDSIQRFTTKSGFKQIARDVILSKNDPRIQLLSFRTEDIKRTIPVKIHFMQKNGKRHCFVDMFFVGLRPVDDLTSEERKAFQDNLKKYEANAKSLAEKLANFNDKTLVFAEIFARFHREYSDTSNNEWNVAFYKVATFDVLKLKRK